MESTLLIVLLVMLLGGWLYMRRRGQQAAAPKRPERRRTVSAKSTEYHAVTLKFPIGACAAAKELDGKRLLSTEAPRIPLPECNSVNCQCHFVHYKDRRTGKDRRNVFSATGYSAGTGKFEQERRQSSERRNEDEDDFF